MLSHEESEADKIEDKLEPNIIEEGNSMGNGEDKQNEIEINLPIKEENVRLVIEEEHKRHHLIDHTDHNIDFKPTSPISKVNGNANAISMYWNENISNHNNFTNRQNTNNIVFNPAVDHVVFSDEGIYEMNLDNSFLSIMDSIQMIDSTQPIKRDLNHVVMSSNNIRKNSVANNDYFPYSQKQLDRERAEIYNEFLQSHNNNRLGKIRKQYNRMIV